MPGYDPNAGRYKDQSIGDTPKVYTIDVDGKPTKVVGVGSKNGGFYVLRIDDGRILEHTPIYTGPPTYPLSPKPDRRMLALPSSIGGLQTGCATDGQTMFTNGIDALWLGSMGRRPPAVGRLRQGASWPLAAIRGLSAGGTNGPGSPRWAGRHQYRSLPTSAIRSPRESPWPTASSISRPSPAEAGRPRRRLRRRAEGDRYWAGLVGSFGISRPRLCRHGEHSALALRAGVVLPEEIHWDTVLVRLAGRGRSESYGFRARISSNSNRSLTDPSCKRFSVQRERPHVPNSGPVWHGLWQRCHVST